MGETGRGQGVAHGTDLILKERVFAASRRMAAAGASWFATRAGQRKRCQEDALLTMRTRQGMTATPEKHSPNARNPAKLEKSRCAGGFP